MITRHTLATSLRKLWKKKQIYYSQVLEGTRSTLGPHGEVAGRDGVGVRTGHSLLGSKGGEAGVPRVHSLLNLNSNSLLILKPKRGNLGSGREKRRSIHWSVIWVTQGFLKGDPHGWGPRLRSWWSAQSCVSQLAMCSLEMVAFEIDPPADKSLMSEANTANIYALVSALPQPCSWCP